MQEDLQQELRNQLHDMTHRLDLAEGLGSAWAVQAGLLALEQQPDALELLRQYLQAWLRLLATEESTAEKESRQLRSMLKQLHAR